MIHITRPASPPRNVTAQLSRNLRSTGKSELDSARDYYGQTPSPTKAFAFKQYKGESVCLWLDDIFQEKCAYCESKYSAVDSRNVEHYRPKGAINEAPSHPGYWWLAADWKNLMPSCPACNQFRKQVIYQPGMSLADLERAMRKPARGRSGKGNAFPMHPTARWTTQEGADMTQENPLLIDPMSVNPANHLEWSFDWDRSQYVWEAHPIVPFLRPCQIDSEEDLHGKTSIATYGLNRGNLVRERIEKLTFMQLAATSLVNALQSAAEATGSPSEPNWLRQVEHQKRHLETFTFPSQPYIGMAKAFISLFELELQRLAEAE